MALSGAGDCSSSCKHLLCSEKWVLAAPGRPASADLEVQCMGHCMRLQLNVFLVSVWVQHMAG